MTRHLLSSIDKQKKVVSMTKSITYSFNPKSHFGKLNVKKLTIYDKDYMDNYVTRHLDKKYKELLVLIKEILEDNEEDSGGRCIDLIDKFEDILDNKFKHYLKIKNYHKFLDKINLLRKYVEINTIVIDEEIKNIGRGGR